MVTCSRLDLFQTGMTSTPWSAAFRHARNWRSEEHTSELQSQSNLVCRLLLEKKNLRQGASEFLFQPFAIEQVGVAFARLMRLNAETSRDPRHLVKVSDLMSGNGAHHARPLD